MRNAFLILFFCLGVCVVRRAQDAGRGDRLRLTFFDVGQGDSALVEFPGGARWLVDAGGGFAQFDEGARVLFPELARLGVLKLDVAFLTHPDADHALGFRGLFDNIGVNGFWLSEAVYRSGNPLLSKLLAQARAHRTEVRAFARPEGRDLGGARARVLPVVAGSDTNDEPLLLRLEFGGCSAFLAADSEAPTEAVVAGMHLPPVDLLKVAHHGSRTSSTEVFLRAMQPRWAVISVGEGNLYRHPHSAVLGRLRRRRANVLRTDYHGYVRFSFFADGRAVCETASGGCGEDLCRGARAIIK